MKVTQVAIRPTPASDAAGRPALTPELLAASGARYSRNNEGLEPILSKIDPNNLDKSVDGIFRMIDYGHQSIADMAPAAMFMDGVSLWLAYYLWTLCPTAGGQESSTRYIHYGAAQDLDASDFGIPAGKREAWHTHLRESFAAYQNALAFWENVAARHPEITRIPRSLLEDSSEKAQKQVARMKRNYAFDRARNFLPVAAPTNVMMIMSARGWVNLCRVLRSHFLPEAQRLGNLIADELQFAAPRLLKHATASDSMRAGLQSEFESWRELASAPGWEYSGLEEGAAPTPLLEVFAPRGTHEEHFARDLKFHENRYAFIGESMKRTAVRFGWEAVALAEIRDLNRHRTGTKYCPQVPRGFYAALDQLPIQSGDDDLRAGSTPGAAASLHARRLLQSGDETFVYWTLLGTQYFFEHTTTADKFIYEAELRTGVGAHFRYARHLHDVLELWYEKFPATRNLIHEGKAEPE
jgi:thymidylate synthase ThyX